MVRVEISQMNSRGDETEHQKKYKEKSYLRL